MSLVGVLALPLAFTSAAHSDENWSQQKEVTYQTNISLDSCFTEALLDAKRNAMSKAGLERLSTNQLETAPKRQSRPIVICIKKLWIISMAAT